MLGTGTDLIFGSWGGRGIGLVFDRVLGAFSFGWVRETVVLGYITVFIFRCSIIEVPLRG